MNSMKISILTGVIAGVLSGYFFFHLGGSKPTGESDPNSYSGSVNQAVSAAPATPTVTENQSKTRGATMEHPVSVQALNPGLDPDASSSDDIVDPKIERTALPAELAEFAENNPMYFLGEKSNLKYDASYVDGVKSLSETGEKNDWSSSYETGIYNETKLFSEFLTKQELSCNIKVCVLTGETTDKANLMKIHEILTVKDLWSYQMDVIENGSGGYTFFFVKQNVDNDVWPSK